jgi:hypothetical protein
LFIVFASLFVRYPINTVVSPIAIEFGGPLSVIISPCRAAGMLLIMTVTLPMATIPPTCGTVPVRRGQVWKSMVALHAGFPPIKTFTLPGPGLSGVPWLVKSPTRAAGGIAPSLVAFVN